MEFIETTPLRELYYLQSLNFLQFKAYAKSSDKNDTERKESFQRVQNYCDLMIHNKGTTTRVYENDKSSDGRRRSKNSPATLPAIIRSFIFGKTTTDLDMKNAQPTILRWLCKQHNISCPELDHYINNRDYILSKGISRDKVKTQYLCSYTYDKETTSKDKAFIDYDMEAKRIQQLFYNMPEFRDIINSVPEEKTNKLGSAMSRILSNYENIILEKVVEFVKTKHIDICALIFDGMLIYGNHYDNKHFLIELQTFINNEFKGINMTFAFKEQKTTIVIPDSFKIPQEPTDDDIVTNDVQASEKLFKLYPHWVCCNDDLYVYDKETGMWSCSSSVHVKIIKLFAKELTIMTKGKNGYEYTDKSYGTELHLIERLPKLLKPLCINDNWLVDNQNTSLGKILFNNGYFDFNELKFYEKDEKGFNNPEIFFVYKIDQNFTEYTQEELAYINSIKQRLFYDPLGIEQGDFLALQFARALSGEQLKRIVFGLGYSNCGKSIIGSAVLKSCGEYAGSFNAENLASRNNNDEAQSMRWTMLLQYKRIIISQELRPDIKINGTIMKKVSSGCDTLVGRNHGKAEQEYQVHFLPFVFAQDLPKIKPYDDAVSNRLRICNFEKTFVDNPSNEYELKKDNNINREIETALFKRCFIGLLLGEYVRWVEDGKPDIESKETIQAKNDWVEQEKNPVDIFTTEFELTNNEKDYVTSGDIQLWLNEQDLGISITKLAITLKKHVSIHKLDNICKKVKKINGKSYNVWVGIKRISGLANEKEKDE